VKPCAALPPGGLRLAGAGGGAPPPDENVVELTADDLAVLRSEAKSIRLRGGGEGGGAASSGSASGSGA
jgi:hypothetical protein